jgi:DNA-binding transcriptional ArsR family regulator
MYENLAETASLLSDPARASMVMALMGGVALPAGQLAMVANIAPQTASSHLARMVGGRLLTVEQQGRHRYYRITNAEVANAVEALLAITPHGGSNAAASVAPHAPRGSNGLVYARSCYSHLAGKVAVEMTAALLKRGILAECAPRNFVLKKQGRTWFEQIGLTFSEAEMRHARFARQCLDWTERRPHIGGHLGRAMLEHFRGLKWIALVRDSRAVRVTLEGERQLGKLLGLHVARN